MAALGAAYVGRDSAKVMQSRNIPTAGESAPGNYPEERLGYMSRKPKRISITVSQSVHEALVEESITQGRSLSNLPSYWLERQAALVKKLAN